MRAVIFDLDDTLAPEMLFVESGFRHVAQVLEETIASVRGEAVLTKEEIYDTLSSLFLENTKNVFDRLFAAYHLRYEQSDVQELVQQYRRHEPSTRYYDDVPDTLDKLKQMGMKLGVITDGCAVSQRNKLKALHAEKTFDKLIVTDELGRDYWKPNAKAFQLMSRDLNVDYRDMIYVGDNPEKDFFVRRLHPVHTVRILRGDGIYQDREYMEGVREEFAIDSMEKLPDIAGSLYGGL